MKEIEPPDDFGKDDPISKLAMEAIAIEDTKNEVVSAAQELMKCYRITTNNKIMLSSGNKRTAFTQAFFRLSEALGNLILLKG